MPVLEQDLTPDQIPVTSSLKTHDGNHTKRKRRIHAGPDLDPYREYLPDYQEISVFRSRDFPARIGLERSRRHPKLRQLASFGEFGGELGDLKVTVSLDEEAKTITVSDNGIGMTADEIKKYINQIAFSGASDFLEKYKDKTDDKGAIIGHFGLGFYSAFMVAEQVEIVTKSYRDDAESARWVCDGSTEFELTAADRAERGTDIILHIAPDSEEFINKGRLRSILDKYARFLPTTVEFDGETINNTTPIWTKSPADLTDEDYKTFYRELYPMGEEPLFWIHLNVDYPFNLTGILYFPRIKNELRFQREKIQLYSRQVFITDEVKDVVPDFLMMLHGVIDSPDIPLNVSRSFLQADSNVKKINGYITRKVADKLADLFNSDRKGFEEKFDDIGLFIKYGVLSDEKFWEKAKSFVLLKTPRVFTLRWTSTARRFRLIRLIRTIRWLCCTRPTGNSRMLILHQPFGGGTMSC
jgi:molecular chaperone HtpG